MILGSHHGEFNGRGYSIILSQLIFPRQRLPVSTRVDTVVDSIALGPADAGVSFCPAQELVALCIPAALSLVSLASLPQFHSFSSQCP